MSLRQLTTAWVLWCACAVGVAQAQSAEEVAADLNRQAMEAYNNLDINTAGAMLEEALRVCEEGGVVGHTLALTNLNLAVVYVGGLGDAAGAGAYFLAAVCADATVQLDPLTSTPDVQAAFADAQAQAESGACGAAPGAAPSPAAVAAAPAPSQLVIHVPPAEQLSQTPLPIYAELNGGGNLYLYYKGLGMEQYQRVEMTRFGSGYAYQISCNDVWEPAVSYYIEAVDGSGTPIGGVGTADAPMELPIVSARTMPAPALPGANPPASCAAGECPPGMACATPGTLGIGEECDTTAQCQSGLTCSSDVCVLKDTGVQVSAGGGGDLSDWEGNEDFESEFGDGKKEDFKRFFFQLGFAAGFPYVKAGLEADRPAPADQVFFIQDRGYTANPQNALDQIVFASLEDVQAVPAVQGISPWIADSDSYDSFVDMETGEPLPAYGDCPADGTETGPIPYQQSGGDLNALYPSKYCVRVKSPGFVFQPALRANFGYFITDSFSVSGIWRLQLASGYGTLANMLFGVRTELLFSDPVTTGFMSSGYLGFTVGQIQAQAPVDGDASQAPWIISGMQGAHVGFNFRYRIVPNFGIVMSPEVDVQFPSFLLNADVTLGPEVAF